MTPGRVPPASPGSAPGQTSGPGPGPQRGQASHPRPGSAPGQTSGPGPGPQRGQASHPRPGSARAQAADLCRQQEGHAERIIGLLRETGRTLAVAESLTGGLLGAEFTNVPGASAVFRGGIIAYAADVKAELLAVPAALLAAYGAVHPEVAAAMADGARARLGADVGVATTGVAGPDSSDGKLPGTVHVAASGHGFRVTRTLALVGDRQQIRRDTVKQCLILLWAALSEEDR